MNDPGRAHARGARDTAVVRQFLRVRTNSATFRTQSQTGERYISHLQARTLQVLAVALWLLPIPGHAQQPVESSEPLSLAAQAVKRQATTRAELRYDAATRTWTLALLLPDDQAEYSLSAEGIGPVGGSMLRADARGGLDMVTGLLVQNIITTVHQRGARYTRWDQNAPGLIATRPDNPLYNQFQVMLPFIGVGSTIRFTADSWVDFDQHQYRKGGVRVTSTGLTYLPGTEMLGADGKISKVKP